MEKQINTIHAYKYDGTLYRVWNEIKILQETNEYVCVQMQDSIIKTLKHNNFFANRVNYPSICYFYKNEWYNVVVKFKGKKIELYINVASPFIICDDVIKYIDLDLDYFVADINVDKIDLLDEDEYKQNIVIYRYSDKLQKIIANTCKKIITLFNDGSLKKCYNTKLLTLTAINEYRNKIIVFQKFNKQFNKLVLAKKVASAQELLDKFVLDNPSICAISRSKIQSLKDELTKTSTNKTLDSSDFAFSLLKKQCEALLKKHDYDHAQAAIMEFNTNDPISAFQNNDKVSALQREISFAKKNSEKNQIEKQFQNADIPTQLKKIYNGHSLNFGWLEEFIDKNGIAQCGSDFLQDIFLDKNVPIQQKKVLLQSLLQSNQDIKMKILNQHLKTIIEISCNSDTKQKLLQWEKDIKHYVQDSCHKTPSILADVENIASALYDFFWPATPPFDAKNLVEYATNYVNETINGNKTISINDYFSKLIKPWTTK